MNDFTLPALFHRAKTGKISLWSIRVSLVDEIPHIITKYGYIDGIKQETSVRVDEGKNLGRSNETTAWEQACAEATSKWNKQQLSNYREELDDGLTLLPMLAHKYKDHPHRLKFPCFGQIKLNGARALAEIKENEVIYHSRKGKQYETLHHWDAELLATFPAGTIVDGEAFNPELHFQEIVRRLKRVKGTRKDILESPLQYWIYDVVKLDMDFAERYHYLKDRLHDSEHLRLCPTTFLLNLNELKAFHAQNTAMGFEGTMLRNSDGLYEPNYRSYNLLKYKDFLDAEYKIIGGCSAKGKDEGTVVFECETETGLKFNVRPKGTFKQRKEYLDNLDQYVGKQLTVRYQETSEDGVPIFPVGLCIRDYE
jgi:ATP-dependent DNA ligase